MKLNNITQSETLPVASGASTQVAALLHNMTESQIQRSLVELLSCSRKDHEDNVAAPLQGIFSGGISCIGSVSDIGIFVQVLLCFMLATGFPSGFRYQ